MDKLGELLALSDPAPVPLPSRIEGVQVAQVRDLTRRLGKAGSGVYTDPVVLSAAAGWAEQLLGVSGAEPVKRALKVAELHLEAAWAGFHAWRYDRAMHHFRIALELATVAGDVYLQAKALGQAGLAIREFGHPNDGLKMLRFSVVKAWEIPRDEPRAMMIESIGKAAVEACARATAATAFADLGDLDAAEREMAKSRELWLPTRADPFGDLDRPAALLALRRGRLDIAESFAVVSVRRWEGISRVGYVQSSIVLATVQPGRPTRCPPRPWPPTLARTGKQRCCCPSLARHHRAEPIRSVELVRGYAHANVHDLLYLRHMAERVEFDVDETTAAYLHRCANQRGGSIEAAAARQLRALALVDAARALAAWDPAGAYAQAQTEERESAAAG